MDINSLVDKVYVICLPKRKAYITNVMNKLGIKYEIIDAILKKNINKKKLMKNGIITNNIFLFLSTFKIKNKII